MTAPTYAELSAADLGEMLLCAHAAEGIFTRVQIDPESLVSLIREVLALRQRAEHTATPEAKPTPADCPECHRRMGEAVSKFGDGLTEVAGRAFETAALKTRVDELEAQAAAMREALEYAFGPVGSIVLGESAHEMMEDFRTADRVIEAALALDAGRQLLDRLAEAEAALRIFPKAYPDRWRQMLHAEGCIGVRESPEEREEYAVCRCDGDDLAAEIDAALAPASEAKP